MSWTLSTSGAAIAKAGANANADVVASEATLALWSDEAEAVLNLKCRKDWVTDYSTITANFKPVLDDAVSDLIALRIINYDMGGYTSRAEAQTMLNVIKDNFNQLIVDLKNTEFQEVMD